MNPAQVDVGGNKVRVDGKRMPVFCKCSLGLAGVLVGQSQIEKRSRQFGRFPLGVLPYGQATAPHLVALPGKKLQPDRRRSVGGMVITMTVRQEPGRQE